MRVKWMGQLFAALFSYYLAHDYADHFLQSGFNGYWLVSIFHDSLILTRAGTQDPGQVQLFYNIHFYKTAFTYQDMGYGATLAWLLFAIAMSLTVLVFWSAKYWVYSPGGTDA